jgi:hypothetical protein
MRGRLRTVACVLLSIPFERMCRVVAAAFGIKDTFEAKEDPRTALMAHVAQPQMYNSIVPRRVEMFQRLKYTYRVAVLREMCKRASGKCNLLQKRLGG